MAASATITNIAKDGVGIRVYATFSDGEQKSYLFEASVTIGTMNNTIKADVTAKDSLDAKVQALSQYIGYVIT